MIEPLKKPKREPHYGLFMQYSSPVGVRYVHSTRYPLEKELFMYEVDLMAKKLWADINHLNQDSKDE